MKTIKRLTTIIILLFGMFLLSADTNYIESCCPRGGTPPPSTPSPGAPPAPSAPGVPSPAPRPTAGPPAAPRPPLGVGLMPLIQSVQSLLGVAEPWEVWWTRNRDKYLSFRAPIEWVNIDDQGGTKSFSISPIYKELIGILSDGVSDKDIYVAFRAAIALGKVQDAQNPEVSSPEAIEILKKANEAETRYFVRNNVLLGWALTSDPAVIPVLKEVLESKDPALRRSYAALALGYASNSTEASKILIDILTADKEDREVKSSSCLSLGNLKNASAAPILGKILTGDGGKKEQGMIRAYAALGLGRIGTTEALNELKKIVPRNEKESTVREAVATALGMTGLSEAKEAILAFLDDKSFTVRGIACIALAQIKDAKAYETISEMLRKNRSNDSDGLMLIALGLTGNEKAKADLRKILADSKKSRSLLRGAASIGLGLLKDTEALPIIADLLSNEKQHNDTILTPYLFLALAMINEQRVEKSVTERDANDPETAQKKELSDLEKQQIEALQKIWTKIDKNLSITAYTNLAIALMKLASRNQMIDEITKHINSKNTTLQRYALHTMGLIGTRESAKVFIESYKDSNPEVRKATIDAIGFLMDKHSINPIDRVTADNIDSTLEIMNHLLPIPVW